MTTSRKRVVIRFQNPCRPTRREPDSGVPSVRTRPPAPITGSPTHGSTATRRQVIPRDDPHCGGTVRVSPHAPGRVAGVHVVHQERRWPVALSGLWRAVVLVLPLFTVWPGPSGGMTPRIPPPCCRIDPRTPTAIRATRTNSRLHLSHDCYHVDNMATPTVRELRYLPPAWRQWCKKCGLGD